MAMLADTVDVVIGVDTHKHTHTLAIVTAATGAVVNQATVAATTAGYQQLLALATQQPGQRIWAIESTGGYGAGLTRFLQATMSRWWSWTGPSEQPAATAPSPTRWTPPEPPARPWAATSSLSRVPQGTEQRSRSG
jgi:transposase